MTEENRERTALERAVLDDGLTIREAIREEAVTQLGLILQALHTETTRLEQETTPDQPLDTGATLRVVRIWRQIVLVSHKLDENPSEAPPDARDEAERPRGLAAQIAARGDYDDQDDELDEDDTPARD